MVSAQNNQGTAVSLQSHHKTAIHFSGITGWRAGIKHIAGNDDGIDLLRFYNLQQPVEKLLVFVFAVLGKKALTEMPV